MDPTNVLVPMSDERKPMFLGAAGHPFIATPNFDVPARGTRFISAYTTCPICAPAYVVTLATSSSLKFDLVYPCRESSTS